MRRGPRRRSPRGAIPIGVAGDGVQALVQLATEFAALPGGSVLVEEPEVYQHPAALRLTARVLLATMRRGVQIILTTHSPFLLDHVYPDEIIHVTRDRGETRYTPIEGYQEVTAYKDVVAPGAMYISGYFTEKKKGG